MTQKQRKTLYPVLFFVGLFSMIFEIDIFRNTIINVLIPIAIIVVVAVISYIIDFKNYKNTYDYGKPGLYLYAVMHYVIGYGFIVCSLFMFSNFYLADQNSRTETYEIVRTSSLASGTKSRDNKKPTFRINYKGEIKELVFSSEYYDERNEYTSVELEIRKGLFGFEVLKNKKLH